MIQVYKPNNSDFTHNGDAVIFPEYAEFTSELNGVWSGNISVPVAEGSGYELITEEAVVKMPAYNGEQLYRILNVMKDTSAVTAELQPIFFDSARDCFITDSRPTSKTGQQALNQLCLNNPKYTGVSDITGTATAYYEYVNLMEAICGDEDNAFIHRWGGEIEYDNFTIRVMQQLGSDKGEEFRYGKQIESIEQVVDDSEVITRIYPKAYNGVRMSNAGYVDSPVIGAYPIPKIGTMTFGHIKLAKDATDEDRNDPDIIICNTQAQIDAALQTACMEQFDLGVDKPKVTITIDSLADLRKIQGFEDFGTDLALGDTVMLYHEILNIESSARIVSLTYDAIGERVTRVTIGTPAENYIDAISSTINKVEKAIRSDGSVKADKISGVIDLIKTNLYKQHNAAELSDVPAILFENNDTTSPLYGAMAVGTQGFQIAKTKDAAGNWNWQTWGTANGLVADYIFTGTISSMDEMSYWNLENGNFDTYDPDTNTILRFRRGQIFFIKNNVQVAQMAYKSINGDLVLAVEGMNGNQICFGDDSVDGYFTDSYTVQPMGTGSRTLFVIYDNQTSQEIFLRSGSSTDGTSGRFNNKEKHIRFESGSSYANIYDNSTNQYIDLNSGGDTYIRLDNKAKKTWIQTDALLMNGYAAYSGTWTVNGKTLTIKNGIITGAT